MTAVMWHGKFQSLVDGDLRLAAGKATFIRTLPPLVESAWVRLNTELHMLVCQFIAGM